MENRKDDDVKSDGAATLLGLFSDDSTNITSNEQLQQSFSNSYPAETSNENSNDPPSSEKSKRPSAGSDAHMMALFNVPAPGTELASAGADQVERRRSSGFLEKPERVRREQTVRSSNSTKTSTTNWTTTGEEAPLLQSHQTGYTSTDTASFRSLLPPKDSIPLSHSIRSVYSSGGEGNTSIRPTHVRLPSVAMPPIQETRPVLSTAGTREDNILDKLPSLRKILRESASGSTFIGAFMYLLYHVVFCLALGSAIIRPNSQNSILGLMTKTAAIGTVASSSVYWFTLSSEIPALYPTADLFLAPFLANLAQQIDTSLNQDDSVLEEDNDAVFLATFGVLAGGGILVSGTLLILSGIFRLTDLASFLPFEVISGFFSAVGILTWTLAVTIDTGGLSIGKIIASNDLETIKSAALHHLPSISIAIVMKYLGPKNPFYVIMVALGSILLFYTSLWVTAVTLDEAREQGWFWTHSELVYENATTMGFSEWTPPAPFAVLNQLFQGRVHWQAVKEGAGTACALGFLYLIRCSVHGAALKKNVPNLIRKVNSSDDQTKPDIVTRSSTLVKPPQMRERTFSEAVDIEAVLKPFSKSQRTRLQSNGGLREVRAKPTNISLKAILLPYGISQIVAALVGGFAVTPSVAASSTMFSLGAQSIAPQIGSVLLLLVFYLTDFQLVSYIPKPAFSSMLVLAFIDMIYTWFYRSYFKTKNKSEWLVVPAIVLCAFIFDLLSAVFLGIAFSTFIFVAAFFRSGVVKFVANASVVHSTIERPFRRSEFLKQNGDFIQILVLQNYLFFGNSSSVYGYISAMFQRSESEDINALITRKPKFLLLDMLLVTGMDTSAVDIFSEIRNLCASNNCKLFVTGLSPAIQGILALGGFKPETIERSRRKLRFFASLDAAVGKAEDLLLESDYDYHVVKCTDGRERLLSEGEFGFRIALRRIDEEHGDNFTLALAALQEFTAPVELDPGDLLHGPSGSSKNNERGLFFIESGLLKIEHNVASTLTHTRSTLNTGTNSQLPRRGDSLTKIQALEYANIVEASRKGSANFRSARIGPGWIAGAAEAVAGVPCQGQHVAVTNCRLHYLPFARIAELEKSNPALVLSLYKLLGYMMARRQEATIGQLATLHSIMTSPATNRA